MKKFNNLFLLLAAIVIFTSSSGMDGAVGPQSSAGTQGAMGAPGGTVLAAANTKHVDLSN